VPSLNGVAHFALSVRNLAQSEAWYRDVFELEQLTDEHAAHYDAVVLIHRPSRTVFSLRQHHGASTARFDESRTGLDHVSFGVADRDDLDKWEARLTEKRIPHSSVAETGFGSVLVFRDPDHIQLELCCLADAVGTDN
jgi:glyoxylase I family protein